MTRENTQVATYRMFVRGLLLRCSVGVYEHEQHKRQPVRVTAELRVVEGPPRDDFRRVFNYEIAVEAIRSACGGGHVALLETLAERVAQSCLADERVLEVTVQLDKLGIFADADSVGIEITRRQPVIASGRSPAI